MQKEESPFILLLPQNALKMLSGHSPSLSTLPSDRAASAFISATICSLTQPDWLRKRSCLTACHNMLHFLLLLHCVIKNNPSNLFQKILDWGGCSNSTIVPRLLSHHCHQAVCKLQKGKSDSSNTELAKPELWLAYQRVREGWDLLAPSALQALKSSCLTGLYLRYKWKNSNPGDSNIHCRNFTAQRTKPIRKPFWQLHYFSAGINDQWFHLWKAEIRLKCFSPDPKGREDDDCSSLRNGTDFLYSCTAQFSIPDLINTTGLSFSSMCTPPTETSGLCSTSVKKKIYEMLGCFLVVLVIGRTTRFDVIWQPQNFLET